MLGNSFAHLISYVQKEMSFLQPLLFHLIIANANYQ